jgi:hypothetical protein
MALNKILIGHSGGGPGSWMRRANYLAFIKLAAIRIWLRAYESTP